VHSLGQVDLNLLVAFDALMVERNVTRAAKRLNITQPALSHSLKRLRETFNDELLVRTVDGMVPTSKAQELHEAIVPALVTLRIALEGPAPFVPTAAQQTFTIGMPDSVALLVLPRLVAHLQKAAPGIHIVGVQYSPDESLRRVLNGELDFMIGYFANSPSGGLAEKILSSTQSYFAIVDRNNPRLKNGCLDRDAYLGLPHIGVTLSGGNSNFIDTALESLGLHRNIIVTVPAFSVVPALVRGSNFVGHCGRRFLQQLAYRDELLMFEPPIPLSFQRLRAVWRRSAEPNPALAWMLALTGDVVANAERAEQLAEGESRKAIRA
jgi:DNA-binding transcriptional LysR family regulator